MASTALLLDTTTPDAIAPRLLVLRLGSRRYGIELERVREVISFRGATRLPGAPPTVAGLINVRGTVVTVLDLGALLDLAVAAVPGATVVLLEQGGRVVGAAVDQVLDVLVLPEEGELMKAEGMLRERGVRSLLRAGEQVVMLLDIDALIAPILVGGGEGEPHRSHL